MSIDDISREIVAKSIGNVICIDDKFVSPYSTEVDELSKDMHESFYSQNCNVDICKYHKEAELNYQKKFSNKDLLVLDWELDESVPKFMPALGLLNEALLSNMKYICIYSHEDLDKIMNQLFCYYSGYSKDEIEYYFSKIKEFLEDSGEEEILNNKNLVAEIKMYAIEKKSLDEICNILKRNYDFKELIKLRKPIQSELGLAFNDILVVLGIALLNKEMPATGESFNFKIVSLTDKTFIIKDKIVMLMNKRSSLSGNSIDPKEIISKLSDNIHSYPNNFLTLLWLDINTNLKNISNGILSDMRKIDEDAFFFYKQSMSNDEFIKYFADLVTEEVKYRINSMPHTLHLHVDEYISKKNIKIAEDEIVEIQSKLARINSFHSCNDEVLKDRCLGFGDVFKCDNDYFICVTAHCDCAAPSKILNSFIFLKGNEIGIASAIVEPETKYTSFISDDEKVIAIKWEDKIRAYHISTNKMIDNKINVNDIYGNSLEFQYMVNQKENYTQRLANNAFSHANRVGISHAGIKRS